MRGTAGSPVRGLVTAPRAPTFTIAAAVEPGEDRGQAVVVVLRPAVERVVVAVGALQPDAEEHLADQFGLARGRRSTRRAKLAGPTRASRRSRSAARAPPGRAACPSRTCSRSQRVERRRALPSSPAACGSRNSAASRKRPVVDEVVAREQPIDELRPLVGRAVLRGTPRPPPGVGSVPVRSRRTRRRNVGVVGRRRDRQPQDRQRACSTSSSMKFARGSRARSTGLSRSGSVSRTGTTRSRKRAMTTCCPRRRTVAVVAVVDLDRRRVGGGEHGPGGDVLGRAVVEPGDRLQRRPRPPRLRRRRLAG